MQQFYGREDILSDLSSLWKKRVSSFVTCRGRRRVGKSTLIEKFAEKSGARFIRIEGVRPRPKMTNAEELANFAEQLAASTGAEDSPPSNWLNAFLRLDGKIDDRERTVVLLDEVSWMAHYDLRFSSTLKIAWDAHLKKHRRLVFVVCGSVSTWILENIIKDGSFYGRRSLDVVVPELPLADLMARCTAKPFTDVERAAWAREDGPFVPETLTSCGGGYHRDCTFSNTSNIL